MPPVAVARVFTEPRRPQRRHFVDMEYVYPYAADDVPANPAERVVVETARRQHISLKADHKTGKSTYGVDYGGEDGSKPAVPLPPRMVRPTPTVPTAESMYSRSLRDGDYISSSIKNRQAEADRFAFVSSYQAACKDTVALPEIAAVVAAATAPPQPSGKSLYQDSYPEDQTPNPKLSNGANPWGKTKLLYVPKTKGTIRDLFHAERPHGPATSYRNDYQRWPALDDDAGPPPAHGATLGPRDPLSTRESCRTVVPKAFKYRKWGGFSGGS
ncbi:hypothetical protein HDU86_005413 [Geranomyces michiganensis]|nr:hypothetical protein HDU86_005413 [Geranomyces michiganensis]